MNILFITLGSINNINRKGIYTDLIRKFRDEKHNMYVISPFNKESKYENTLYRESGVNILRINTGQFMKNNFLIKGINMLRLEKKFLSVVKSDLKHVKFDAILYATPPVTFANVVEYFKRRDGALTYLMLKDIFPQNAVDLKIMSKVNPLYHYFKYKEKKLYDVSEIIGCMSPANKHYIQKHHALGDKIIEILPNAIEVSPFKKLDNINELKIKLNLPLNKLPLIYGGNLGRPQGLDFLARLIKETENKLPIHFLVAGSGTEESKISSMISNDSVSNLTFIKELPREEYENLVKICDVGLILLDKRFTIPNFPSRLLSYMEAKLPIISSTDVITDIGEIAEENKFGIKTIHGNLESFENAVNILMNQKVRSEMGNNGYKFLLENYTIGQAYSIIIKHFNRSENLDIE